MVATLGLKSSYYKAIMELNGKIFTGLGPILHTPKNIQVGSCNYRLFCLDNISSHICFAFINYKIHNILKLVLICLAPEDTSKPTSSYDQLSTIKGCFSKFMISIV